jgi:hypothetical protein
MAGLGRVQNIWSRIELELTRLKRLDGSNQEKIDQATQLLREALPVTPVIEVKQTPSLADLPANSPKTTPYDIAANRLDGWREGKYTWDYFIEAWNECNEDDKLALNELVEANQSPYDPALHK